MTLGHFDSGYWLFIKKLSANSPVPCEENPEVFFPEDFSGKQVRQVATALAKSLCNKCPVKKDCFTYAVESGQRYGIWAGTTAAERQVS